jgi:hypothetical protein
MDDEDDLYFKCEVCNDSFEADSEAMYTLEYSSYLISNNPKEGLVLELYWEGIGPDFQKKVSPSDIPIKLPAPEELSNLAICICKKCKALLLTSPKGEQNDY